jgi:hypothetical protein
MNPVGVCTKCTFVRPIGALAMAGETFLGQTFRHAGDPIHAAQPVQEWKIVTSDLLLSFAASAALPGSISTFDGSQGMGAQGGSFGMDSGRPHAALMPRRSANPSSCEVGSPSNELWNRLPGAEMRDKSSLHASPWKIGLMRHAGARARGGMSPRQ